MYHGLEGNQVLKGYNMCKQKTVLFMTMASIILLLSTCACIQKGTKTFNSGPHVGINLPSLPEALLCVSSEVIPLFFDTSYTMSWYLILLRHGCSESIKVLQQKSALCLMSHAQQIHGQSQYCKRKIEQDQVTEAHEERKFSCRHKITSTLLQVRRT